MARPALFVAVTALLAACLAVAGAFLARSQGETVNVWLSLGTGLVIGTFLAFLIMGSRLAKDDDDEDPPTEGFAVVSKAETEVQMRPRDPPAPEAPPPRDDQR